VWFFLGNIDEEFRNPWLETIYKHCNYINKNISRYSSANNHLIGEAAGLFVASVVWPFKGNSEEWNEQSYKILIQEIEKQNYNDGVNKEQAICYQQFVMDFFILAGLLGEKNGVSFPQSYWSRIEKMLEFIASIMDGEGNVPYIGDSDDGYAVILSDDKNFNPYQSLLASGAIMFKRGDLKRKAGQLDEKSLWLLGPEGIKCFNSLEEKKLNPIKTFKNGGYYVLSAYENTENEIKSVFDCGPLGYLRIAAHGHSDALSYTLSVGGKQSLIDPGTFVYQYPRDWRDYFKGTSAHNTIRIDGKDQSVIGGYYMWLKKAQTKLIKWESNDIYDSIKGEHNGYMGLEDPVMHQREIIFFKKRKLFRIIDRIQAKKNHLIEQFFHFSDGCEIKQGDSMKWEVINNGKAIILKVDKQLQTRIVNGSKKPILGWKSERFDVKEKTFTMVNSANCEGYCEFETLIFIN
ncbi:alginate lyase family protein, partial [bacterium]|nr:alginate lyase family protein [bacterium]